jgi:hypothetical protein
MGVLRMHHSITIQSVGVDWLTVTASEGKQRDLLREYGIELMMADAKAGNRVYPFRLRGYEGGSTKSVQVGERGPSVLVRLMGIKADSEWEELLALAQGCSRIDLQVSVRQEPFDKDLAIRTWQEAKHLADAEGKPPQYDLYARKNAGSTLYIGDRASRYFARMYDRWAKTKQDDDLGVWRYEVEAKRERAAQVAATLPRGDQALPWAKGFVYGHFATRGVSPIFAHDTPISLPPLHEEPTDADRSIAYLGRVARPVLERLSSWGRLADGLRALGPSGSGIDAMGDLLDDDPHF